MTVERRALNKKPRPTKDYILISGCWMYGEARHALVGRFRVSYVDGKSVVRTCYAASAMSHDVHAAITTQPEEQQCANQSMTTVAVATAPIAAPSPRRSGRASYANAAAGGTACEAPNIDPAIDSQRAAADKSKSATKPRRIMPGAIVKKV
jgi:hypothetical protein